MPARSQRRITQHIPGEILLLIFSHFKIPHVIDRPYRPEENSLATLAAVARCSKWFYHVTMPLLYKTIYVSRTSQREALTRAFSRQPDLGRLVHSVRMDLDWQERDGESERLCSDVVKGAIRDRRRKFILPSALRQRILYSRKYRGLDSEIAFLLAFVPNLKELGFAVPAKMGALDVFQYITQNSNPGHSEPARESGRSSTIQLLSQGHFAGLQNIYIYAQTSYPPFPRHKYEPDGQLASVMFNLPKLVSFSSQKFHWGQSGLNGAPIIIGLRRLELDVVNMDGRDVVQLVSRCPRLCTLKLVADMNFRDPSNSSISLKALGDILRNNLSQCLENLMIITHPGQFPCYEGTIGSLRKLVNLRMIFVHVVFLVGGDYNWNLDEFLPNSLEQIFVIQDSHKFTHRRYIHNQVLGMMSMETRSNLMRVHLNWLGRSNPDPTDFIRNTGQPGWNVAYGGNRTYLEQIISPWPPTLIMLYAEMEELPELDPRFKFRIDHI